MMDADEDVYRKVDFQRDLAVIDWAEDAARKQHANGEISGFRYNEACRRAAVLRLEARKRYAQGSGSVFGGLRNAKSQLARCTFSKDPTQRAEIRRLERKVRFLKIKAADILDGCERATLGVDEAEPMGAPKTWVRYNRNADRFEICRGGCWNVTTEPEIDALGDSVRWI